LTDGAKSMTLSEDSEKNEKQRMDLFYSFLKQRAHSAAVEGAKSLGDILHEAERYASPILLHAETPPTASYRIINQTRT
jgi:hypothetical protein